MEEKIGINIKEASDIMGISKQLMTELTKLKDFPCFKFSSKGDIIFPFDNNNIDTDKNIEQKNYIFIENVFENSNFYGNKLNLLLTQLI